MHYQIPKRAHRCAENDEPFSENDEIITLLIPKKLGFDRKDLCLGCFKKAQEKYDKADGSYWKVTIAPKSKKERFKHADDFLNLLRTHEMDASAHYLLCLFLQRQKILHKQKEKGDELFFECLDTGEVFVSKKCALSQESLNHLMDFFQNPL